MNHLFANIFSQTIQDFLEIIQKFLPNVMSSVLILLLGFIVAWIIRVIAGKIGKLLKIDRIISNSGLAHVLEKNDLRMSPIKLLRQLLYWTIVLIFAIISLASLKVPAMENLLEKFFLYLPHVFISILLLFIGFLVSNFVGRIILITQVNAGVKYAGTLSKAVKYLILMIAIVMATEQLGIGQETVLIAFAITFGGIVLALAIAFGFGGKKIAKEFLEKKLKGNSKDEDTFNHI